MSGPSSRRPAASARLLLVCVVAALTSACAGSVEPGGSATGAAGSGATGSATGVAGTGAVTGAAGAGAGAAGTGVTGAAGRFGGSDAGPSDGPPVIVTDGGSDGGVGGMTGAAGATGAAGTGAAGTGVPACQVQLLRVVLPASGAAPAFRQPEVVTVDFTGLESGPSSILRVKAVVTGFSGDLDWEWTISPPRRNEAAVFTALDDTFSELDISLLDPGEYELAAKVKGASQCGSAMRHLDVSEPSAPSFLFRVTPPSGSLLPTKEWRVGAAQVSSMPQAFDLGPGGAQQMLSVAPIDAKGSPLAAFVRVTGPSFGFNLMGYTGQGPFVASLDPELAYEVLIIPDGPLAPLLIQGRGRPQFFDGRMTILKGMPVHGSAVDGKGRPVVGARVLLRAEAVPSTVGVTGADGLFNLETRGGPLSATIVPPTGSGLPEAHVPSSPGIVPFPGISGLGLSMAWASSSVSASMDVTVRVDGAVAPGVRVRAETVAELQSVGELRVRAEGAVGASDVVLPASGSARAEAVTDGQGVAHLGLLPLARYHLTAVPPMGSSSAVTSADVELQAGGLAMPLALAKLVRLTGRLEPTSAGARIAVTAVDRGTPAPFAPATTETDAAGAYALMLSPGRSYELLVEPPTGKSWSRAVLAMIKSAREESRTDSVPPALPVTALVKSGARPVPGTIVQVFCVTPPASCVDPTVALAEGVTLPNGTLSLLVPDLR